MRPGETKLTILLFPPLHSSPLPPDAPPPLAPPVIGSAELCRGKEGLLAPLRGDGGIRINFPLKRLRRLDAKDEQQALN